MDPKMDPKMAPGTLAQGPYLGVPGQKPLIFTSRMAKTPDLGPGPRPRPVPLYIGEIALFGPWGPGPGPYFSMSIVVR